VGHIHIVVARREAKQSKSQQAKQSKVKKKQSKAKAKAKSSPLLHLFITLRNKKQKTLLFPKNATELFKTQT